MLLGIDLGNGRTKTAYPDPTGKPQLLPNMQGELFTPSVVYFPPLPGKPIVGTEAQNMAAAEPKRVVTDWKRSMGTDDVLYRDEAGAEYRAKDIAHLLLMDQKAAALARLGKEPNECVICVPANYNDVQKQQTIEAAERAGMKVLQLAPEPTAAALGNELYKFPGRKALVYDLGAGTFDVSLVKSNGNVCEVLNTNGVPQLGGRDFNERIREEALARFVKEHGYEPTPEHDVLFFQELGERIESVKVGLSVKSEARLIVRCNGMLLNTVFTRDEFESKTADLLEQTIECSLKTVEEPGLTVAEVDEIYCVGGGSLMPMVSGAVEKVFGKKPARKCEPHYAAALGAVYVARMAYQAANRTLKVNDVAIPDLDIYLKDIISYAIGVMVVNDRNKLVFHEILPKGTSIPSRQMKTYKLDKPGQTVADIEILQGEDGQLRDNCVVLGHCQLKDLPPSDELTGRLEIDLNLDANGMLTAVIRDRLSGKTAKLEIDYKNSRDKQNTSE